MALNGLFCADVPLEKEATHSLTVKLLNKRTWWWWWW